MSESTNQELVHLIALLRNRPKDTGYLDVVDRIVKAGSATGAWSEVADGALFTEFDPDLATQQAGAELARWRDAGYRVTAFYDSDYPAQLRDINEMPPLIWTQGTLVAGDHGVSVVGTRKPSTEALTFVRELVEGLVDQSRTIVSGLAAGVDAEAHRSALASRGRTVAIIGTGIDLAYPAENRLLQERIAASGLLLSQFWPGSAPTKKSFPMRNAVMSGYSRVSVIVEASERSGTRIQARLAVGHGRPVILTQAVARGTTWGAALLDRPGVAVATTAASAVEMAVHMSRPRPVELASYLALMTA
jgi:DNA processing protein